MPHRGRDRQKTMLPMREAPKGITEVLLGDGGRGDRPDVVGDGQSTGHVDHLDAGAPVLEDATPQVVLGNLLVLVEDLGLAHAASDPQGD